MFLSQVGHLAHWNNAFPIEPKLNTAPTLQGYRPTLSDSHGSAKACIFSTKRTSTHLT